LSNDKGEKVVMNYDAKAETFSMDRTKSGKMDFSKDFAAVTKAPTYGNISQLRIFIDKSSIEALDADGKMSMTNLVFPIKRLSQEEIFGY
jgi:fructan beta-fructosidase